MLSTIWASLRVQTLDSAKFKYHVSNSKMNQRYLYPRWDKTKVNNASLNTEERVFMFCVTLWKDMDLEVETARIWVSVKHQNLSIKKQLSHSHGNNQTSKSLLRYFPQSSYGLSTNPGAYDLTGILIPSSSWLLKMFVC